jgi:hypothetical protein
MLAHVAIPTASRHQPGTGAAWRAAGPGGRPIGGTVGAGDRSLRIVTSLPSSVVFGIDPCLRAPQVGVARL